jgi:predicted DNA-binding transcriptional regulator AlpA
MSARLLNVNQVATLLQVHRTTVYRWIKDGLFPRPVKNWGFPLWDYDEVMKAVREDKLHKNSCRAL